MNELVTVDIISDVTSSHRVCSHQPFVTVIPPRFYSWLVTYTYIAFQFLHNSLAPLPTNSQSNQDNVWHSLSNSPRHLLKVEKLMLHCLTTGTELIGQVFGLKCLFLQLDDESVTASNGKISVVSESIWLITILNFDSMVDHVHYNKVSHFLLDSYRT